MRANRFLEVSKCLKRQKNHTRILASYLSAQMSLKIGSLKLKLYLYQNSGSCPEEIHLRRSKGEEEGSVAQMFGPYLCQKD